MVEKARVRIGCRIAIDEEFQQYVNSTYDAFLDLARCLSPQCTLLTDSKTVSQLQDLYFLIREGILKVSEEKSDDGGEVLFLEI